MLVGFVLRLLNTMFAERAAPVLDLYVLFSSGFIIRGWTVLEGEREIVEQPLFHLAFRVKPCREGLCQTADLGFSQNIS